MPFTAADIIYGGVVPVVVTGVILAVMRWVLPTQWSERYAASAAILSGILTGLALLPLVPWVPVGHWHWLPYAVMGAALVGPFATPAGVHALERPLLYLLPAAAAAWVLVPASDGLEPTRTVYLCGAVGYIVLLATALEPLAKRSTGPLLPTVMWATMVAAAMVLERSGSLRFVQIAGIGAAAMFGCLLAAWFFRSSPIMTGSACLFATLAVGLLLCGRIQSFSEVKLVSYALIPLAPLLLWIGQLGVVQNLSKVKQSAILFPLAISPAVVAVVMAILAEPFGGSAEY